MSIESPPAPTIPSGRYVADPALSELRFRAKAFGLMWVDGRLPVVDGTFRVATGRLAGEGTVSAAKVDTGLAPRDWHLRTSHYLSAKKYPTISMSVADAALAADVVELQIHVRGHPSAVELRIDEALVNNGRLRLQAHGTIDRSGLGMLGPWAGVSRLVRVTLTVVASPVG
jgi:polyisoprenoid-binding protein YceI